MTSAQERHPLPLRSTPLRGHARLAAAVGMTAPATTAGRAPHPRLVPLPRWASVVLMHPPDEGTG